MAMLPKPFVDLSSCWTDLSALAAAESAQKVVAQSTMLAMARLLGGTEDPDVPAEEEEDCVMPPPPPVRRRPLFEAHGAAVQSRALAAHLRGYHHVTFDTGAAREADAVDTAPWLSDVQKELAKEGTVLDGRALLGAIACLRPPKTMLEERRTRLPRPSSNVGQAPPTVKAGEDMPMFIEPVTEVSEAREPIAAAARAARPMTSDGREIRSPESPSTLFSPDPVVASEASTRCATAEKVAVRTVELPKVEPAALFGASKNFPEEGAAESPISMLSAIYRRGACRPTPLQWPQGRPNAFPGYDGYERRRSRG